MRYLMILAVTLLASWPAGAEEISLGDQSVGSGMGQGIICNTSEQAARFIDLRNDGAVTAAALDTVNAEAKDPSACGTAMVAFTNGQPLAEKTLRGMAVRVVKITIIAANNGLQWSPVRRMVQYTIIAQEGVGI